MLYEIKKILIIHQLIKNESVYSLKSFINQLFYGTLRIHIKRLYVRFRFLFFKMVF